MGKKLNLSKFKDLSLPFVSEADFCIHGSIPPFKRRPEGPFGDHYGYYALEHDYPFVEVKHIFHRNDAIYPATIVGRPPQEDHYIAEFLQDLLSPLFPLVMPGVKQVWAYEESGVHSLAASVVNNRYPKEAFTHALRILGEGQLSLTKFLLVTDQPISLKDVKQTLMTILERTNFATDLFIFNHTSQDTLDYTGPEVNKGSKAILLGLGEKKRALKETWTGKFFSACFEFAQLFCPGILCVKAIPYVLDNDVMDKLKDEPDVQKYPLVVVLDDPQEACKSPESFIWHVFTRFEPASDLYGRSKINNMHLFIEGSLMIDCRFKPWYPKVLEEDTTIAKQVQEKWGNKLAKLE